MSITAYEDIKSACAEAIKSMRDRNNVEVNKTSSTNDSSSDSAVDVTTRAKDQKKEKFENEA
jgi:archaellum component FlaF (FlaF/FlaG flagellin family)